MQELYDERLSLLKEGESFVIASIFDFQGSAPRTTGARMIIKEGGTIFGTVGGGRIEALVIAQAKDIFETKKTILKEYKLQEAQNKGIGMACGGDVSILMEYVDGKDDTNLKLYEEVIKCTENGEKSFIIRKFFDDGRSIKCLYKNGEIVFGEENFNKEDISKYESAVKYRQLLLIKEDNASVLIEPVCNLGKVYIFGAGHVGQKFAKLAKEIDFMTCVVDNRPEFANRGRLPSADEIIAAESYDNCFENLKINKDSYIVIVTSGHLFDFTVLKQALKTDAYYIGMIGSRRKRNVVYEALKKEGFTMDDFNRVHNPIGIEIGARTSEEIAVSIAAELIDMRSKRMK